MRKKDERQQIQCSSNSPTEDENDVPATTALIEVSYAGDGTPSVEPTPCHGSEENDVLWRTARGEQRPFKVVFISGNPAGDDDAVGPLILESRSEGERQTGRFRAKKVRGTSEQFLYTIEANGVLVNAELLVNQLLEAPAIIIEP